MDDASMRSFAGFGIVSLVGVLVATIGVLNGLWWLTFPAGLLIGASGAGARFAIPVGGLAGIVGWGIPLAYYHVSYGMGPTARSLAAIMGFTNEPYVPVILTCLVGLLLGMTGAWLSSAVIRLLVPAPR
jgi:hypothetical protein